MLSPYRTVILLVLSCLSVCLAVTLVYCGQTAGWIKMKPGVEIGLGPGHIVLNGDPSPLPKGGTAPAPAFQPCLLCQTAGWIKMPLDSRPRPRRHCLRWGPSSPPHQKQPFCSSMSICCSFASLDTSTVCSADYGVSN